jgi:hypothetical protein
MNYLNANELKSQVSIVTLLSKLGYEPVPKHGKEKMYISMLRENDTSPSFSVNEDLGLWYDHGIGRGGNVIDFGLAYWNLGFQDVVKKINDVYNGSIPRIKRDMAKPKLSGHSIYQVEQIKVIGTHPAITEYLKSRGVFKQALAYLKEVYYAVEDENGQQRKYFAAGWKNEHDGWEVRNRYFKGCIGNKGISIISNNPKKIAVFEGFLDFLSWRVENPESDHSILVLNSLSMLRTAISKAKAYSIIDVFFDRDKQGIDHTKELLRQLPYATDRSKAYEGFNDYNDKLKQSLQAVPTPNENGLPVALPVNVKR